MKSICKQCWKEFDKVKWNKLWNICSLKCRDERFYKDKPRKSYHKYKTYNCIICWKECKVIDDYRVKWISENKVCKDKECKLEYRRQTDNKYNERIRCDLHFLEKRKYKDNEKNNEKRNKLHTESTFFSDNKNLYDDKIINFEWSPTGKAYIWIAKQPLIPNDNWIWYKGVLIQSENRTLVQCSECWKWYKIIPENHLKSHWLTREQYREKYWLNKTQALVSDTYSRYYSNNIVNVIHNNEKYNKISEEQKLEWSDNARNKRDRPKKYNTDQMKNNKWTCDLQLKHRFIEYILWHHKYPPFNKYPYPSLKDRFWSINNALKEYWLPIRQQIWFSVLYEFNDWYSFKITKWRWYEELFDIMKLKCIALKDIYDN